MEISSFTKGFHRTTYPAIDPSQPALSAAGKTVIVTGAYRGNIGAAVAHAFAAAGSTKIALVGETLEPVEETKHLLQAAFPAATVVAITTDYSDAQAVGITAHQIRAELGAWDVFVHTAETRPVPASMTGSDLDDWWRAFEINVKFMHNFARHFLTKCRPNSTFISFSAEAAYTPVRHVRLHSSFSASKLAAIRLNEFLSVLHPSLRVFSVCPNISAVRSSQQVNGDHDTASGADEHLLEGNFSVWLASPQSEFLRGRFVSANWDVEELAAKRALFEVDSPLLTTTIGGWPFQNVVSWCV